MSNNSDPTTNPGPPTVYQIRVKGHLGSQWTNWFEGLTITLEEDGDTLLTGPVIDQAALHGLLKKVRDLGMQLVSVSPVDPGPSSTLPLRGLRGTGPSTTLPLPGLRGTGQAEQSEITLKKGDKK